jgi:hypothetical protein
VRRRTNPALIAATVLTVLLTAIGIGLLTSTAEQLRVAKADAFDSIIALSHARSVSYDANADESRYLVDPQRASQYQQAFQAKSQSLLDSSSNGYLGTEMRNITFPGERAAAERMLAAYQAYQDDDRQLRSLATSGDLTAAVAFDIGTAPGNSDYAFTQYDNALVAVIQINQNAFTTAVRDGQAATADWTGLVPGSGTLLIIGLVGLGLWPRMAEYR